MINKLFNNQKLIVTIWILLALISSVKQFLRSNYNNYHIFKNVFYHIIEQKSLYATYPNLYFDHNHYGPIFGIFMAPFAIMPDGIGMVLWCVFNALFLVYAIRQLNLESSKINLILWIIIFNWIIS